jgi:polyvinyl alcohol dehydrogenase (cytochrome)
VVKSRWLLPDHLGPSGAPVWSQPTIDVQRQRIYVGTGENYSSPATDTSDAILAFDMNTGAMVWKQQFVRGDAWNVSCVVPGHINCPSEQGDDLDFGAPPILVEVAGRDYVLAGQKSGNIFALDPDVGGALLWSQKAGAGNKGGGIHIGMAVDPIRGVLYVPISDRPVGFLGDSSDGEPKPSIQAFDIQSGELLWATDAPGDCLDRSGGDHKPQSIAGCFRGFSAPVTATENIVFAPTLDGHIRAFDARNGSQLWHFDTRRDYAAVNGSKASGGAIDIGGAYLDGGQLFISSGYGLVSQIPGNAFMVFEVTAKTDDAP